jgi:hypothetical protein
MLTGSGGGGVCFSSLNDTKMAVVLSDSEASTAFATTLQNSQITCYFDIQSSTLLLGTVIPMHVRMRTADTNKSNLCMHGGSRSSSMSHGGQCGSSFHGML